MDFFWWLLIGSLMLIGVVGTLIPMVPGHVLILVGAVVHELAFAARGVGWPTVVILSVIVLMGLVVDFLSGAAGAKYFGATRWGALGGILGAIIGLFFGLPGMLLGPLLGVLVGELLGGKGILPAGKSTWGSLLGGIVGGFIKLFLALLMVGIFFFSLWYS